MTIKQLLFLVSFATLPLSLNAASTQAPATSDHVRQTKNGFGINFDSLGEFEENLLTVIHEQVKMANDRGEIPRFLFQAAAYGRLPLRVLKELKGDAEIVVNELSAENLEGFIQAINNLATLDDSQIARNAKRVITHVGDCFELSKHPAICDNIEFGHGHFDIIVADNLLHFFNGKQILDFLLLNCNMLKPTGKLFLFFEGRIPGFTYDQILASGNPLLFVMHTMHVISTYAERDENILFPGYFLDEWLKNRSYALQMAYRGKPNNSVQSNFIPWESIAKIAKSIGFDMVSNDIFEKIQFATGGVGFSKVAGDIGSVGMVLSKPESLRYLPARTIKNVPEKIVISCINAEQLMSDFINGKGNLEFHAGYPFVTSGIYCHSAKCLNKGTEQCGRCKKAKYCSRECQVKAWTEHKKVCCK